MQRNIGGAVLRRTAPIEDFKLEKRLNALFSNRLTASSEREPQSELNLPGGCVGRGNSSRRGIKAAFTNTRKDAGRHSPKVGVVGKIEKFRPKLQTPLGIHKELALDGKVDSEDRRRDQRVAANIP